MEGVGVAALRSFEPIKCAASDTRWGAPVDGISIAHGVGAEGDLVLVEALADHGAYREVEDLDGRPVRLYSGDRFIAVLGHRESSQCLVGGIPAGGYDTGSADVLHLLTNGGIVGICESSPGYMGEPLPLACHGRLLRNGNVVNTADQVDRWCSELVDSAPLVLVGGTAAEAGKTTVSAKIIAGLSRRHGLRVAGTKLAGTGCLEDVLQHRDAGAAFVLDFPDVGLPSTYTSPDRFARGIRTLLYRLNEAGPDVIVGELGGDFIWANIPELLQLPDVMSHTVALVLIPVDVVAGVGAVRLLEEWGVTTPLHLVIPHLRNPRAAALRIEAYLGLPSYDVTDPTAVDRLVNELAERVA